MKRIQLPRVGHYFLGLLALLAMPLAAAAVAPAGSVRQAAGALEQQLRGGVVMTATEDFRLPLTGSAIVLNGEATLEAIEAGRCRRTLELVHDQPFERRGLRITNLSRRSVQEGPCRNFGAAMAAQAEESALNIAGQIGIAPKADSAAAAPLQLAQTGATAIRLNEAEPAQATAVMLTVREKALIRDAPSRQGEKLSRADAGTQLKAWRIAGNADWFALDGGLRFISASVVDASDAAPAKPQAMQAKVDSTKKNGTVRLKVVERAVLRNKPSFKGQKVAQLAAGVERLARKVPGMAGWFELADSESRYPLYIHESVVSQKPSDKRL